MKIIVRVRELRKTHNLTQEELAKRLNISRQSLISLEQGRWLPSLPLALQLARYFNAPLEQVIFPLEDSQPKRKEAEMPKDLIPGSPFRELRDMRDEIDRIFDQSFRGPVNTNSIFPAVNIRQDESNIYLEAHVPGFTEQDIDIDIADDMVAISGKVEQEKREEGEKGGYLRQEYHVQSFNRNIGLPSPVISDKAQAKLTNGVLTITLPKIEEEKPKIKRIKPTT